MSITPSDMPYSPSRAVRLTAAVVLGFLLLGAGCRNPFRKDPSDVLRRAQDQMVAAQTSRSDVHAVVDIDVPTAGGTDRVHLDARSQGTGTGLGASALRGSSVTQVVVTTVQGDATIAFEYRVVDVVSYVKLTDIAFTPKGAGAPPQVQVDAVIGAVKGIVGGQWVKLDPKELASLSQQFGGKGNVPMPSPQDIQAFRTRFAAALRAHPLLVFRADLGNERVNDIATYHYRVGMSNDAVSALVDAVAPLYGLKPEDVTRIRLGLASPDLAAILDAATGEVWVAKRSGDLARVRFPLDLSALMALAKTPAPHPAVSGFVEVTSSDWGKPVTVDAPANAKSLQELIGGFLPLLQQKKP